MAMQTPHIPAERWIANLLEAAQLISNCEYQETSNTLDQTELGLLNRVG